MHIIIGNHDMQNRRDTQVDKDGIPGHESLILQHARTGRQVFVTHGRQADIESDQLHNFSMWVVRHPWRPSRHLGFGDTEVWSQHLQQKQVKVTRLTLLERLMVREVEIEQRLIDKASRVLEDRIFKWLVGSSNGSSRVERKVMAPPRKLRLFN